ncbi:MAG: hypothetical protein ACFB9M_20105 [Myxococcota bacterium]
MLAQVIDLHPEPDILEGGRLEAFLLDDGLIVVWAHWFEGAYGRPLIRLGKLATRARAFWFVKIWQAIGMAPARPGDEDLKRPVYRWG